MLKLWPLAKYSVLMPTSSPMSPVRVVKNALSAASELAFSSHQWPISMNEQTPMPSQPSRIWMVVGACTISSIDAVKRLSAAKKWV